MIRSQGVRSHAASGGLVREFAAGVRSAGQCKLHGGTDRRSRPGVKQGIAQQGSNTAAVKRPLGGWRIRTQWPAGEAMAERSSRETAPADNSWGGGIVGPTPCCARISDGRWWRASNVMSEVTRNLGGRESDDPTAADELLPLVYEELHKLAAAKLAEPARADPTLQATAHRT